MLSVLAGRKQQVCSPARSRQGRLRTRKQTLPRRERNKVLMRPQRSWIKPCLNPTFTCAFPESSSVNSLQHTALSEPATERSLLMEGYQNIFLLNTESCSQKILLKCRSHDPREDTT